MYVTIFIIYFFGHCPEGGFMKLNKPSIILRCIAGIIAIVIALFLNWLFLPAWNIRSGGFWWYGIIVLLIATLLFYLVEVQDDSFVLTFLFGGISVLLIVIGLIVSCTSSELFHAVRYANLITIQSEDFHDNIQELNTVEEAKNFPLLDVETAQRLGNRSLSELEKVSQFEVNGEYNLIYYNGKQYRLSPLEYASFFRALNNTSIPGYVLVDSQTQESQLVQLDNGIQYAPSAVFAKDLTRYLRNRYPSYIFDKYQFDIDDSGIPYYIAPVLKPTIGLFGGKIVKSFVIMNAHTGECTEYFPEDLPEWVDHAYSLNYLMRLAKYYYSYQNGYWNTWFANNNVKDLSYSYRGSNVNDDDEEDENPFAGYNSILTAEGVQFFTCVVSVNTDESALGFILANSKTGKITYYDCVGAEESSAQLQAESLYQNFGYTSSYPLMVTVEGEPTYVISLKDKAKINKAYALVNVANYTISSGGETLESALTQYKEKLFGTDSDTTNSNAQPETSVAVSTEILNTSGTITELYQATQNGTTQFFFVLEGDENLYISSISNNSRQVQLTIGSYVTIEYHMSTTENLVGIVSKIEIQ